MGMLPTVGEVAIKGRMACFDPGIVVSIEQCFAGACRQGHFEASGGIVVPKCQWVTGLRRIRSEGLLTICPRRSIEYGPATTIGGQITIDLLAAPSHIDIVLPVACIALLASAKGSLTALGDSLLSKAKGLLSSQSIR